MATLTRQRIVAAAFEILDAYGLGDLSMRRLAGALGVQPGALYNHVPSKQMLLAWLADDILAEVAEPLGPWRPTVDAWARSLRTALLAHRDSADLVATARGFRLSERDVTRHPAIALAAGGLAPDAALAAAGTLLHFVVGHVAEEQAAAEWERSGQSAADPAPATEASFLLGLTLVLDGIAAQLGNG